MGLSRVSHASVLLSSTPPPQARAVSLAVHHYVKTHRPTAIVVGFSAGADSLALLTCAIEVAARENTPILAVTVDHGWRPDSADQSADAADLARALGAAAKVVALPAKVQSEAHARQGRYRILEECAQEFGAPVGNRTHLLVGHTQDDQAETVLLRLGRGASSKSLAAMRPLRRLSDSVYLGRPLLQLRRRQTIEFCQRLDLPVFTDPSNDPDGPWKAADGNPFRRAALRERAIPALSSALQQDSVPALAAVATSMQQDEDALAIWASQHYQSNPDLVVRELEQIPVAVRKRVYRLALRDAGSHLAQPHHTQLQAVDALVCDWHGQGAVDFPGGLQIARRGGRLVVNATLLRTGRINAVSI